MAEQARRQHGNVTRAQLIACGLTSRGIVHRVAAGRLHPVHRGVYAVGRPARVPLERAAAAVLACGPTALLSHGSALTLWGIWKRWEPPFEVTITKGDRRPEGITVHRCRVLHPDEARTQLGIRATSPARAILDAAPGLTAKTVARAVNDARLARLLTLEQLAATVARAANHPGAARLTPLLERDGGPTRSEFEDAFAALCREHGLPAPQLNATVCGLEVDALFAEEKLIVELDGWTYHRGRVAFERDRERDARTLAAGYGTVRITWERQRDAPTAEAARLQAILAQRRASPLSLERGEPGVQAPKGRR